MIDFRWEDKQLKVSINYGVFIGKREYDLRNDLDPADAVLRAIRLNDELDNALEKIAKKAYDKGYEDHKKKRPKETWFARRWEPMK